jgi:soluble lytic murein transglycosylase-like protein
MAVTGVTGNHSKQVSSNTLSTITATDEQKIQNQILASQREKFRQHQAAVVLWNQKVEENKVAAQQAEERKRQETLARARVTTPKTYVTPAASNGSPCQYSDLIHQIFGPDGDWATAIAYRESRCIPTARNASGASGLFQMMLPLHSQLFINVCGSVDWTNPECNVRAAYALFKGSGRSPWNL